MDPVGPVIRTTKIGHAVDGLVVAVVRNLIHEMAIPVVASFAERRFLHGTKRLLRWSKPISRTMASPEATAVVGVAAVVGVEAQVETETVLAIAAAEAEAAATVVVDQTVGVTAVVPPTVGEAIAVTIANEVTAVVLMVSEVAVAVPMVSVVETNIGIPAPSPANLPCGPAITTEDEIRAKAVAEVAKGGAEAVVVGAGEEEDAVVTGVAVDLIIAPTINLDLAAVIL